MVEEKTCHLTGVIDWAEAEIAAFGLNIDTVQGLAEQFYLRDGWSRFDNSVICKVSFGPPSKRKSEAFQKKLFVLSS